MPEAISIKFENDIAVLRIANPPVNALSWAVRTAIRDTAMELSGRKGLRAVVLVGDGRCFCAGADISEFGKEPPKGAPTTPEAIAVLESLNVPVVAGLHGFAFGGGLELAMGTHYRIAVPETKMGLTEVDLGIIPGAGGTQRLPRLVGIENAAQMITEGRRIDATAALDMGLIDEIAEDEDIAVAAVAFAERLLATRAGPRPTKARSDVLEDKVGGIAIIEALRDKLQKRGKGRIAPLRALDAVSGAVTLPFDDGIKAERAIFVELVDGPEARAMRHLFKAEREAQKIADAPADVTPPHIETAGVVGLGTMGQGIALVLARAGIEVIAVEIDPDRLDAGLDNLRAGLEDRVSRGRIRQDDMDAELSRITGSTEMADLADVDVVIEAALEDMTVKATIFKALDEVCKPDAILTTNTSSLDIDAIAALTSRPGNVAGAHFFAPAQVMKLLEIVRGKNTSPETAATLMALCKRIGKVGVAVGNSFGFVANRMYHRYTWQAYFALQEGALPEQVDAAMQDFGFPLGCLAVGDISGLDVAYHVRKAQREIGDIKPEHPYPVIADRIVEKGWLGRKTKRGWYRYDDGKPAPDPEVAALIAETSAELGITRREISADDIRERCLFALINEGARLLGNGIAARPGDIDIVWRYGYGFPVWRGGPMFIADEMGMAEVLATLERLRDAHGPAFEPAPLIVERAKAGKTTLL